MFVNSIQFYASMAVMLAAVTAEKVGAKQADADTADYVMTDFNNRQQSTPFNGYWYTYNDNREASALDSTLFGNSKITSFDSTGFAFYDTLGYPDARTYPNDRNGADSYCLRIAYQLGDRNLGCGANCSYAPHIGFGTGFTTMADTLDLTGSAGIAFWAKADKAPVVMAVSVPIVESNPKATSYSQKITVDTTWKMYTIKLVASSVFVQPYGTKTPFVVSRVKGLAFDINLGDNATLGVNAVNIDDVTILKWKYVEPDVQIIPDAIARKDVQANGGLQIVSKAGSQMLLRLPTAYQGHSGKIEAVDPSGRVLGQAAFTSLTGNQSIAMDIPNSRNGGWYFRISAGK